MNAYNPFVMILTAVPWALMIGIGALLGYWKPSRWVWVGVSAGLPLLLLSGPLNFSDYGPGDSPRARLVFGVTFPLVACLGAWLGSRLARHR